MNKLERLGKLAEKATPRPWVPLPGQVVLRRQGWTDSTDLADPNGDYWVAERIEACDGEFIVAAVNALPDLLAVARAAKALDDGPAIGGRLAANLHDALAPLLREEGSEP